MDYTCSGRFHSVVIDFAVNHFQHILNRFNFGYFICLKVSFDLPKPHDPTFSRAAPYSLLADGCQILPQMLQRKSKIFTSGWSRLVQETTHSDQTTDSSKRLKTSCI